MIRKSMLVVSLLAVASTLAGGSASARPESARHEVAGGWEKLGAREVDGKVDRDVIAVGREDGHFTAIQIQVDGSALEMFDIKVTFADGETFEPKTRLVFAKNSRSRNIDLPGNRRVIKKVEFRYGNLPGGGRAKVELWGRSA